MWFLCKPAETLFINVQFACSINALNGISIRVKHRHLPIEPLGTTTILPLCTYIEDYSTKTEVMERWDKTTYVKSNNHENLITLSQ